MLCYTEGPYQLSILYVVVCTCLEEGMATHSGIPAWRIPMDRGAWRASPWVTKSQTRLNDQAQRSTVYVNPSLPTRPSLPDPEPR